MGGNHYIMKLFTVIYYKFINFLNLRCQKCVHRITFLLGALTGGLTIYFMNSGSYTYGVAVLLAGGGISELFYDYFKLNPRVVLVSKSKEEVNEEFKQKIREQIKEALDNKENN